MLLTVGHFGSSGTAGYPVVFLMDLAVVDSAGLSVVPLEKVSCLSGHSVALGLLFGLLGLAFLCGFGVGCFCGRNPETVRELVSPRRSRVGASSLAALHTD